MKDRRGNLKEEGESLEDGQRKLSVGKVMGWTVFSGVPGQRAAETEGLVNEAS